jgi:hypothetical protein
MRRPIVHHLFAFALTLTALPDISYAQDVSNERISFGSDAVVKRGETVKTVIAFGGDAIVDGHVLGDVTAIGGDVVLGPSAEVGGTVASLGGTVQAASSARFQAVTGMLTITPSDEPPSLEDLVRTARSFLAGVVEHHLGRSRLEDLLARVRGQVTVYGLLFLLGLLLMGLVPDRLRAMQIAIVRAPVSTGLLGLGSYIATVVALVLFALTIVGIPVTIGMALLVVLATSVGLAVCATVIGAALPIERLRGHRVLQLGAGVLVLFVSSMVPYLGDFVQVIACCLGFGALVRTRFRTSPPRELVGEGPVRDAGPYRSWAA